MIFLESRKYEFHVIMLSDPNFRVCGANAVVNRGGGVEFRLLRKITDLHCIVIMLRNTILYECILEISLLGTQSTPMER